MKKTLFITGSSGFIAGRLLEKLRFEDFENVYCLSRSESRIMTSLGKYDNFKFIKGSLYDIDLYSEYLSSSDTVIHFAAITGKAMPENILR